VFRGGGPFHRAPSTGFSKEPAPLDPRGAPEALSLWAQPWAQPGRSPLAWVRHDIGSFRVFDTTRGGKWRALNPYFQNVDVVQTYPLEEAGQS